MDGCIMRPEWKKTEPGDFHMPLSTIHVLAVLVYAFITVEAADALMDWVGASGKNLTTINATHGQGDHFFGRSL
jgi:hypothetical protein